MTDARDIVTSVGELASEGTHDPGMPPAGIRRIPSGVDGLSTEHLIINMGPQHPSTHGVLRVIVEVDGEEVVAAESTLGYLHRGIEKLAETRRFDQLGTLMDRGDYVSGIHGEQAAALAVEKLMEIEVPSKARWIRSLMAELTRIASHLVWYGTFGLDTGAMGQFLYAMRDREAILDILEAVSGQRMMFNYVRPGGVVADLPVGIEAKIIAFCDGFDGYLEEHHALLGGNEIFQHRVKGVGVIDREMALAFGLSGANLRAAGVGFDVRRERPYDAYSELEFDVPIGTRGDAWDRYMVRMEEMRQSVRMVRQAIAGMPEGEHTAKVPKVIRVPAGEVYASVESSRGETAVHMVTDGGTSPVRYHYRGPSLFAVQLLEEILPGHLLADVVMMIGSLDIMLGEADR
ncbi:MAG: NADH-quinone oxidoreductase subunit D [Coriobacteriia bacterium]|nr:NADH-quinone oxidoreductase subunit D [Coriobacteriia bacterium]MDO9108782.1 NADH-quinone oxidoreductase subunit D [Coriobacteriia bacterium]